MRPFLGAAFRAGAVMGFLLSSLGLLVLFITIKIFGLVRCAEVLPGSCSSKQSCCDHGVMPQVCDLECVLYLLHDSLSLHNVPVQQGSC